MQRIYNVLKQSRGSAIYQVAEKIFRNLLGKISPFSRNDIWVFLGAFAVGLLPSSRLLRLG